eukprot:810325-Rhodomonas_salina.1
MMATATWERQKLCQHRTWRRDWAHLEIEFKKPPFQYTSSSECACLQLISRRMTRGATGVMSSEK